MVGAAVSLGILKVQVFGASRGVVAKESAVRVESQRVHGRKGAKASDDLRMLVSDFSGIRIHTTSRLSRLDVAPYHGCHVTFIVHEAGVKVGSFVWVGRDDVRTTTGEWVFQEVKHGKEFALGHEHVIPEETASY